MAVNWPVRTRQSGKALGISIILLEFVFFALYLILFSLVVLGYIRLPAEVVSAAFTFFLIVFFLLIVIKVILTLLLLIHWLSQNYEIRPGEICYTEGLLTKTEKIFSLGHVEDILISQGFLGKVLKFGTIRLNNPVLNKKFYLYS